MNGRYMLSLLTSGALLGSGLIAGVFFAFSSFVMPALARLPPLTGIAAMQSINVAVLNRYFLGVLQGTAAACLVIAVASLSGWSEPRAGWRLGGSGLYLVGVIGVTRAFNIPLNDALARLRPDSAEAARFWPGYVTAWSNWNHVRTAAPLLAAACFLVALLGRR